MEINVMDENEVRHMYMQGFTVKQIREIMYKQAQKRLKEEITKYTEWTIISNARNPRCRCRQRLILNKLEDKSHDISRITEQIR